jgi:yeast amino acid transporter
MNTAESGLTVFSWLSNLSSLFTLFGWGMICLSNIRMRAAWKLKGRTEDELPWKSWAFPYGAWWGFIWCIILAALELYIAISPLNATPSVENFFANYSSVVLIIVIFIGAKFYFRTPWVIPLEDIDLDEGRRFYHSDDVEKEAEKPKGFAAKVKHIVGKAVM